MSQFQKDFTKDKVNGSSTTQFRAMFNIPLQCPKFTTSHLKAIKEAD